MEDEPIGNCEPPPGGSQLSVLAIREMEAAILKGLESGPAEPVTAKMWATLRESVWRAPHNSD